MKRIRNHKLAWLFAIAAVAWPTCAIAADAAPNDRFRPTAQREIVPEGAKLEVVWNDGDFTEGPVAAGDGTILFTDIGNRIMRFDPATGKTSEFRRPSGKANGLFFDPKGRLVACEGANGGGRRISITEADGKVRTLADRWNGKRFNSPNDLAIDARGRVYFTDPRYVGDEEREIDVEGVYLVNPDGKVTLATRNVQKPNGILVAPDGKRVYVADNNSGGNVQLVAFDVQADGTLAEKKLLFDFVRGRGIDGMTLDAKGNIYATAGTGAAAGVYVFNPEGKPLAFIPVPGDPTNCVFGVGKTAQTLFITGEGPKPDDAATKRRYALYRIDLKTAGYQLFPSK